MTASIILDMDGTLCDNRHRQHFLSKDPQDWEGFFSLMHLDECFDHVRLISNRFIQGFKVHILTGRPERFRKTCEKWLDDHLVDYNLLVMREDDDLRKDTIVKREMLELLLGAGYNYHFAIDDRKDVLEVYKKYNIPCFHVDGHLILEKEIDLGQINDGSDNI